MEDELGRHLCGKRPLLDHFHVATPHLILTHTCCLVEAGAEYSSSLKHRPTRTLDAQSAFLSTLEQSSTSILLSAESWPLFSGKKKSWPFSDICGLVLTECDTIYTERINCVGDADQPLWESGQQPRGQGELHEVHGELEEKRLVAKYNAPTLDL